MMIKRFVIIMRCGVIYTLYSIMYVRKYVHTYACTYVSTDARTYLKSSEYVTLRILNCFALFCCDAEGELVCVRPDQMLQFKKHTLHMWKYCVCVRVCVRVVGYVSVLVNGGGSERRDKKSKLRT